MRLQRLLFCLSPMWSGSLWWSPVWSGFTLAMDHQPIDVFLSHSKRCGFCPPDLSDFDQLLEEANDQLFERILNNPHHTLYHLLPPQSAASENYNLRRHTHDRQLHEQLNTRDTWVTVTSLQGCCTKIHANSIIYCADYNIGVLYTSIIISSAVCQMS